MTGPKYCLNYESGDYEWIDENGFNILAKKGYSEGEVARLYA